MHLAAAQRRIEGMMIPLYPGLCLADFLHGWTLDLPPGVIDQSVTGAIPWLASYETVRAVVAATMDRWRLQRAGDAPAHSRR